MDSSRLTEEQQLLLQAKQAASVVQNTTIQQRNQAIRCLIEQFKGRIDDLLETNTLDLETSRDLALPAVLLHWLKLTPGRLHHVTTVLEQLLDPLCFPATGTMAQHRGTLIHYMPVGVIGLIYEALPELALILAGMCLKTGNVLVLRGGTETSHTNGAIADIIHAALEQAKLPLETIVSLPSNSRTSVETLTRAGSGIDLVIPYGRLALVQQIRRVSEIPMLRSAIGNCYLFWSSSSSVEQVQTIISQSHRGYPEAVNAIDKVIIPNNLQRPLLNLLWDNLEEEGFEIQADQELCSEFPDIDPADPVIWGQASLRKMVAFKLVDNIQQGTQWINTYSSGHADCLVSDSSKEINLFMQQIQSACVFINRSPEFSRKKGVFHSSLAFGMAQKGGASAGVIDLYSLLRTKEVYQAFE